MNRVPLRTETSREGPVSSDEPKLVSIEQFRRTRPTVAEPQVKPASINPSDPTTTTQASLEERLPEGPLSLRTERRVASALLAIDKLKKQEMLELAASPNPEKHRIRFSASLVAREAKIGRTQLYEGNSTIRIAIESARAEIDAAWTARCTKRRPISKRSLEDRIAELEASHEAQVRRLASSQLADLIARMGPYIEEAQRGGNQTANLENRIRILEDQLASLAAVNKALLEALERSGGR